MASIMNRSFASPDEQRRPDKTEVDVVHMGGASVARFTMQPGWKWSECIQPVAGTEACQTRHVGVIVSGRIHIVHEDGTEVEASAGEAYVVEPGHDAWVVGDEPWVAYEFETKTAEQYAAGAG